VVTRPRHAAELVRKARFFMAAYKRTRQRGVYVLAWIRSGKAVRYELCHRRGGAYVHLKV
jgi:hypothetical protein